MSCMSIYSDNPKLSWIINKNPETGMIVKKARRGKLFGWYSKDNKQYNIYFHDAIDEISFGKTQDSEFEYIDSTRYSSPLFIGIACQSFLHSVMNNLNEELDTEEYYSRITIPTIEIKSINKVKSIFEYFKDYSIRAEVINHDRDFPNYNIYSLTIESKNKSIHELINLIYLLSYIITAINHIFINIDDGIISRLVKASNILKSPYYIKYIIKAYYIKNKVAFDKIKDEINKSTLEGERLSIKNETNKYSRKDELRKEIPNNYSIVDFGCGEGEYLDLSRQIEDRNYYAIDKDESCRNTVTRLAKRKDYNNVMVLESLEDFFFIFDVAKDIAIKSEKEKDTKDNLNNENFILLMTEVFEHNDLEYNTKVLKQFISMKECKKILITTPNRDFNQFYNLKENEKRHEDHKFEMNKEEIESYFSNLLKNTNMNYKIENLGDEVNNIATTIKIIIYR